MTLRNPAKDTPRPTAYPAASTILEVLGLRVVAGRFYGETEAFTDAPVAVVDRQAAHRLWPGQNPIGLEVIDDSGTARHVVGVVDTLRTQLTNAGSDGVVFLPFGARPRFMFIAMRDPELSISPAHVQATINEVAPGAIVHLRPFRPFERTLGQPRFLAALMGTLGLLTMALTIVGVFGIVHHDVAARTREMGIRISLGADTRRILSLVLSRSLASALAGTIGGVVLSLSWTSVLGSLLFGLEPTDVQTLAIACGAVAGIALLASLWPAWRASSVDPVVALRAE